MNIHPWKFRLQNLGLLVLRLTIGIGIVLHGWHKITGNLEGFAESVVAGKMGLPYPLFFAWAAALSEFAGGLLIVLGFATRLAAFFGLCVMAFAFFLFHATDSWNVKEMAFVYGSVFLTLVFTGGGVYSLDHLIFHRRNLRA